MTCATREFVNRTRHEPVIVVQPVIGSHCGRVATQILSVNGLCVCGLKFVLRDGLHRYHTAMHPPGSRKMHCHIAGKSAQSTKFFLTTPQRSAATRLLPALTSLAVFASNAHVMKCIAEDRCEIGSDGFQRRELSVKHLQAMPTAHADQRM